MSEVDDSAEVSVDITGRLHTVKAAMSVCLEICKLELKAQRSG